MFDGFFLYFFSLASESPRWLYAQKRSKEADRVMERIARWNKSPNYIDGMVVITVSYSKSFLDISNL